MPSLGTSSEETQWQRPLHRHGALSKPLAHSATSYAQRAVGVGLGASRVGSPKDWNVGQLPHSLARNGLVCPMGAGALALRPEI